jgi:hypothetical protein
LIVLVPLTLLLRLFVRMPAPAWVLAFVFVTLAASWSIHMRVRNDWRAARYNAFPVRLPADDGREERAHA